jgi:hypothetical protein
MKRDYEQLLLAAGLSTLFDKLDSLPLPLMLAIGDGEYFVHCDPEWTTCISCLTWLIQSEGLEEVLEAFELDAATTKGVIDAMSGCSDDTRVASEIVMAGLFEVRNKSLDTYTNSNELPLWRSKCPKLTSELDDEGLLELPSTFNIMQRAFIEGETAILPHESMQHRRSFSPDADLLSLLLELSTSDSLSVRIAPSYRCAVDTIDYRPMDLADHWHGRPFVASDLDNLNSLGTTVHTAPESPGDDSLPWVLCLMGSIDRCEFRWSRKHSESIKAFEAEEVLNSDRRPGRFIHALRDTSEGVFTHIDGALMHYSPSDYAKRLDRSNSLPKSPRASKKPKVFRIDGRFGCETFGKIMSLFFRSNPLVAEYLGYPVSSTASTSPPAPSPPPTS